jgi:hypothetical protein
MPRPSKWPPPFRFSILHLCMQFSSLVHATCSVNLILLDPVSGEVYKLWKSSSCYLLHSPATSSLSYAQTSFSSAPRSQTPPQCVHPVRRDTKVHNRIRQGVKLQFCILECLRL